VETKSQTLRCFLGEASPRLLLVCATVALGARIALGSWGAGDLLVLGVIILIAGPVEWTIHLFLLHANEESFRTRRLGTGRGHKQHHLNPTEVHWILLTLADAALFLPLMALFTALWTVPLLWLLGWPILLPYLTAVAAAWIGLGHYEWTHLLVHSRYRPTTRYYARLAQNHRLHHYRNEHFWLGVTSNAGDRMMGTLPKNKTDVPLSATAKTLDQRAATQ
jgi:Fatty acid hydroxylase